MKSEGTVERSVRLEGEGSGDIEIKEIRGNSGRGENPTSTSTTQLDSWMGHRRSMGLG